MAAVWVTHFHILYYWLLSRTYKLCSYQIALLVAAALGFIGVGVPVVHVRVAKVVLVNSVATRNHAEKLLKFALPNAMEVSILCTTRKAFKQLRNLIPIVFEIWNVSVLRELVLIVKRKKLKRLNHATHSGACSVMIQPAICALFLARTTLNILQVSALQFACPIQATFWAIIRFAQYAFTLQQESGHILPDIFSKDQNHCS